MEFHCRGQKAVNHPVMESDCSLDGGGGAPLNLRAERLMLQVAAEDLSEDGVLSLN